MGQIKRTDQKRNKKRCRDCHNVLRGGICGSLFGAEFLMGIFIDPQKTQIIQIGTGYLKTEGACYCGIGILFLLYGYFRAVERPKVSLLLTILSLGTRVVLAYACAPLFGVGAIWTAIPIGWAMADVAGIILLRRGERTNRMNEIM